AARLLFDQGAKIVALSDVYGGVTHSDGLNPYDVLRYVETSGKVPGYPGAAPITNEELLTSDCEVLIPAAVQSVLTEENAPRIKAGIVVEAANGPTTPEAEKILLARGIFVVPDILANGGGTTIAHLERVQGLYDYYWTAEEVHKQYEVMFVQAYREVYQIARQRRISMRMAAWVKALKRIEEAIKTRGWV
ncbi:MAG: glutamate dehydrogenase, partial [Armatimonadetes bacterium]|nr:glutamate dehydrogenase [Armatimonadota bacterium]